MTVKFSDITDIELRKPGFLSQPTFCFIINGKRLVTENDENVTQFVFAKNQYDSLVLTLERLVTACGLNEIKKYESSNATTEKFDSEKYSEDGQTFEYDSLSMKIKDGIIHLGGVLGKKLSISSIVSCDGMSYSEDIAFHKVKITFKVNADTYIVEGRTFDDTQDIPFERYYKTIVMQSGMSEEDKNTAIANISISGGELLADAVKNNKIEFTSAKEEKDASVVGRAIVGGVIAGATGAIVGAISALDENNRKKKE